MLGMVTTSPRQALQPGQFAWLQNVMPLGPGALSVVPNKTSRGTVSGETINSFDSVTISGTSYLVAATSLGNVYAWDVSTYTKHTVVTGLSTSGLTFCPFQNAQLLILDPTNGLYHWPGTGTAAVADASITGTTIAYWQGYVWVASGLTVQWSAPDTYTDWTAASGGGSAIVTDQYMEGAIQALEPTLDLLYVIGNGAVIAFSNVNLSSTNLTTFQVTNISQIAGISNALSATPFENSLLIANGHGLQSFYGLNVQSLSDDMDIFFSNVDYTKTVALAPATIYNQLIFMVLAYYTPDTAWYLVCCVRGKWFLVDYGTLSFITWLSVSGAPQAYATDGTTVYSLFDDTSTTITGKCKPGFIDGGDPTTFKHMAKAAVEVTIPDATASGTAITFTSDTETSSNASQTLTPASGYNWLRKSSSQIGQYLGVTVDFTLANATFEGFMWQYSMGKTWPSS